MVHAFNLIAEIKKGYRQGGWNILAGLSTMVLSEVALRFVPDISEIRITGLKKEL